MDKILIYIILTLSVYIKVLAQDSPILIPNKLELKNGNCNQDSVPINNLLNKVNSWGYQINSEFYNDHVVTLDLNKDGDCEYILKYYDGGANIIEEINIFRNNELFNIGTFWENTYAFINSQTDYPDILVTYYEGHKTNPIWKFKVLRFDGSKYTPYYSPNKTYGELRELGLNHYKKKDYELAYIYFSNILTVYGKKTTDINNLAILQIKQGKYDSAEKLLLDALTKKKTADTYYNLSLIYKNKNDIDKELDCLIKSNNLKGSDFKTKRIKELREEK